MPSLLITLGGVSLVELLLYLPFLRSVRRLLAAAVLVALAWFGGLFFINQVALGSGLVLLISFYRIFNLLRVAGMRMPEPYVRHAALRTSWSLMLLQLIVLGGWWIANGIGFTALAGWITLAVLQLALAIGIAAATRHNLASLASPRAEKHLPDRELPSISVCIPARNETLALESCLRALLANDYPKLEILVLDDQSHDRTPEIIRSFAHDGVRFISGNEPPPNWLAKNWAYERLYKEASGEILVFAGVDVRFTPTSLRAAVTTMLQDKAQMVCLLPDNTPHDEAERVQSVLLQPARYAWELCLPRWLIHRPPVLSTCWLATKQLLTQVGAFEGVARAITPESHFAKQALTAGAYRFWQADGDMRIRSIKSLREQWQTALRTRYPQLHRRPELVLLLSLVQLTMFVMPYAIVIGACATQAWPLAAVAALTVLIHTRVYVAVVRRTFRQFILRSLWSLPAAILLDVLIRHRSMWGYEFGHVIWKERDVTAPLMQVTPHLPPLA